MSRVASPGIPRGSSSPRSLWDPCSGSSTAANATRGGGARASRRGGVPRFSRGGRLLPGPSRFCWARRRRGGTAAWGVLLHAALHWHWAFNSGPYGQQVPRIIEAGAATVIAVTVHSPFGETERSAGPWLPCLRLLAAAGMCGLAIALLQLGAAGESLNDGVLVLARNVIGITGIGLLCSLVTGGLLAWTLPMGYLAFCQYALLAGWTAPWTWPVRPPPDPAPSTSASS